MQQRENPREKAHKVTVERRRHTDNLGRPTDNLNQAPRRSEGKTREPVKDVSKKRKEDRRRIDDKIGGKKQVNIQVEIGAKTEQKCAAKGHTENAQKIEGE